MSRDSLPFSPSLAELHFGLGFVAHQTGLPRVMATGGRAARGAAGQGARQGRDGLDVVRDEIEALVVATGAPRQRGCPAWVMLGHFAGGRDGRCRPGASAPLPFAHTGKSCSLIPELPAGRAEVLL